MSEEKNEQNNTEGLVFGIDLGTTYSAIAYIDETGRPSIISNVQGFQTTPSVVYFESETNVVVGDPAKQSAPADPDRVVSFVKREIGDSSYRFSADGKDYDPITISSFILKKLAKDASEALGKEVKDVVITCPAYFGNDERAATKSAGQIAGLNVLRILNEPTAAAFAYGLKLEEGANKTILVYDLGGGTFDITIIKISDKNIEVVATGGDSTLGGKDWDRAIMEHIVSVWKEETGETDDILADDPKYLGIQQELSLLAEKTKMTLSSREKIPVKFQPEGYDGVLRRYEFTREKFDEITDSLLERTITLTKEILQIAAEKEGSSEFKYDEMILVGGSTAMPQVPARISQELGVFPSPFEPNQAVAKGAAIMAKLLNEFTESKKEHSTDDKSGPELEGGESTNSEHVDGPELEGSIGVKDVLSKSYGIVANYKGNQCVWNLLFAQTTLPTNFTQTFKTQSDNQKTIEIVLMENDHGVIKQDITAEERVADKDFSKELSKATLIIDNSLPKGSPIEVSINVNTEGLLHLTAVDPSTGKSCDIEVKSAFEKTAEEIEVIKEELSGLEID